MEDELRVSINADTSAFVSALDNLEKLAGRFGDQLTGALRSATVSGRSLEDVLRRIGLNMAGMALSQGLEPLSNIASSAFTRILGGLGTVLPFAKGGVPGHVVPFADGGVVNAPTLFPMGGRTGLMGEAGAEAILPLRRAPDGRLGVAASAQAPVQVTFNVTTADAPSFRKSEAQITGMLARAVSRGTSSL